jgi:hypothetical protein
MAAASMYDPVACGGSGCVPGSRNSYCSEHNSFASRMLTGIYECLAVPDPCYEPGWRPIMDVGMFTECARPVSQQRIRLGTQQHMTNITRNSYRIAPPPIGPTPIPTSTPAYFTFPSMNIYEASIYTEIAAGNVAVTFDVPFCLLLSIRVQAVAALVIWWLEPSPPCSIASYCRSVCRSNRACRWA